MVLYGHIGSRRLVRAFVAIPTPEDIVRKLTKLTQKFQWPGCKLRWSTPEQMHLTVQFLGNVEWVEVGKIGKTLKEVAAPFSPLTLNLSRLAVFPPRNQPRVIVATLEPNPGLMALVQALQVRLQADHQIVPENRSYKPHVTLGRVKSVADEASGETLRAELAAVDAELLASWGMWDVDELTFFQSNMEDGRTEYIELSHAALKGELADPQMGIDGKRDGKMDGKADAEEDAEDSADEADADLENEAGETEIEIDLDADDDEDEDDDGDGEGDGGFAGGRIGRGGRGETQAKSFGDQVAEALAAKAKLRKQAQQSKKGKAGKRKK